MLKTALYFFRLLICSALSMLAVVGAAQSYEEELKTLAEKLVAQLEASGQINGTVLDFTDLQGQPTELGRFLAQELSDKLVSAAKSASILDRASLQYLLRENKLSADGLVDPKTTRKLGNLVGIDTLIVGTVTPLGDKFRLSVRAIAVETSKIVASQSITLSGSGGLANLYTHGFEGGSEPTSDGAVTKAPSSDVRGRFRADSIKIVGKFVKYTKWLDGTQSCWNGAACATVSFTLQNLSGVGFNAAIKAGATSIGPCVGNETEAAGLNIYDTNPGWSDNVPLESALRFVPGSAKVPIVVKVEQCSSGGEKTVDVGIALTLSVDGQTFEIPLSAPGVPVR